MIGFLATGNEVVEGDILNTNGQRIAQTLVDNGLKVGMHVATSDREEELRAGLQFLLTQYDTIITIGGLGPTSDDRTRYAVSDVTHRSLVFDTASWQAITERYARLNLKLTPELENANRQQALFPEGAIILPNKNGSAAGCKLSFNNKNIFMLPGPPTECLPMFNEYVLPDLTSTNTHKTIKLSWLLLGVIEGEIAAQLDAAVKHYPVTTGYRIALPYLEVKIYVADDVPLQQLKAEVEKIIAPFLISTNKQIASEMLSEKIVQFPGRIAIADHATGGLLASLILTPTTCSKLKFVSSHHVDQQQELQLLITGLEEFWQGDKPMGETMVNLQYQYQAKIEAIIIKIPFRNQLVRKYAVEYIAHEILQIIENIL